MGILGWFSGQASFSELDGRLLEDHEQLDLLAWHLSCSQDRPMDQGTASRRWGTWQVARRCWLRLPAWAWWAKILPMNANDLVSNHPNLFAEFEVECSVLPSGAWQCSKMLKTTTFKESFGIPTQWTMHIDVQNASNSSLALDLAWSLPAGSPEKPSDQDQWVNQGSLRALKGAVPLHFRG